MRRFAFINGATPSRVEHLHRASAFLFLSALLVTIAMLAGCSGASGTSSAATVEDLIPYMEVLFRSYRYKWVYGSPNGGYFAFQPAVAPRFDAAIARANARASVANGRPGL